MASEIGRKTRLERWADSRLAVFIGRVVVLVVLLSAWQLASGHLLDEFWISKPTKVAKQLYDWFADGSIYNHLWITCQETAYGFLIGTVVAVFAGLVLGMNRSLGRIFDPFLNSFYGLPKYALAPLFVLWFGIDIKMKITFVVVVVFFDVFWNTFAGVRSTPRSLLDVLSVMGAGRVQRARKVILPGALPYIYVGLKIGLPAAFKAAVVSELIASNRGLGYLLLKGSSTFDVTAVLSGVILVAAMCAVLNEVLNRTEERLMRWKTKSR